MASQPYLGGIFMFAGNFAPRGYMLCQGQILAITQNTALFSILGTTYGGNGTTTFALPDLRCRVPIGEGSGPGLSPVTLGEVGGSESTSILTNNLPAHSHPLNASTASGSQPSPTGNYSASVLDSNAGQSLAYNPTTDTTMAGNAVGLTGGGVPINVQSPYLGINFIIAVQGIFPSRN